MGKIDEQLRNIPQPTYHRDKDKLMKHLDNSYREMLTHVVTQLSKGVTDQALIREIEIMKQVNIWAGQLDKSMAKGLDDLIKKTFNQGQAYHLLAVGEADTWDDALSKASFNRVQRNKMEALLADTYEDILMATHNTAVGIKKVVRDTVAKVAQYHSLRNNHYDEQAKDLYSQLTKKGLSENIQKKGFVGITDKAGRKWDLKVYSNMVIKTKTNQAFSEGIIHEAEESGIDLAIISDHSAEDACSKWEGVIISMTGATAGYPTYAQARATNQIFHPNCEHNFHPVRNLDLVHPDDLKTAQKKAKALKLQPPKKVKPKAPAKVEVKEEVLTPTELTHENIKMVRKDDIEIYGKLGKKHYNAMYDMLDNAPVAIKQVWSKLDSDLKVEKITRGSNDEAYNRQTLGVTMNITAVAKGNHYQKPYQTAFHEFGHNIDYIANVKYGNGRADEPISNSYKNGLFANTIRDDFANLEKGYRTKHEQEFNLIKHDIEALYKKGYLDANDYRLYKEGNRKIEQLMFAQVYYKNLKPQFNKNLQAEIRDIPLIARGNVSDIIEGVSNGSILGGVGHGAEYWYAEYTRLGAEAFAEFFDATVTNADSLDNMKKYFPNAFNVFEEILKHINEG